MPDWSPELVRMLPLKGGGMRRGQWYLGINRRKGVVCAQVAVRKLEEECFPHYVVLDDEQPDQAVARFGRMIADLARRSLAQ